jgi:hypothetical protein
MRPRDLRAAIILATLAFAALGLSASASAKPAPKPSASSKGELYDTTPSGGTLLHKSTNHGSTWTQATTADPSSGDDCVTTDQSGAIYECKLAGSQATAPLQADVWKSLDDGRRGNTAPTRRTSSSAARAAHRSASTASGQLHTSRRVGRRTPRSWCSTTTASTGRARSG